VTTFAGSGSSGSADGSALNSTFNRPSSVATDRLGNIYIADAGNSRIRKITSLGIVSTVAGYGNFTGSQDGVGSAATFSSPSGIAVDYAGNIYVADTGNNKIRKITPSGNVSTLAGSGNIGSSDGIGQSASFKYPSGVAVDGSGNVYVADTGNSKIRKITSFGVVTTLAGSGLAQTKNGAGLLAGFATICDIVTDSEGNVYVSESGSSLSGMLFNQNSIRKITPSGNVITLAGSSSTGSQDGAGSAATFNAPRGLAVDISGNIYVADAGNHKIRKVSKSGIVSTLAGYGVSGNLDASGANATFNGPTDIVVDSSGNLFVADFNNRKIRKITISQ
jgi:sugar lactone lactonase YvrE